MTEAPLAEDCYATPAIAGGNLYIRTRNTLFCFGNHNYWYCRL